MRISCFPGSGDRSLRSFHSFRSFPYSCLTETLSRPDFDDEDAGEVSGPDRSAFAKFAVLFQKTRVVQDTQLRELALLKVALDQRPEFPFQPCLFGHEEALLVAAPAHSLRKLVHCLAKDIFGPTILDLEIGRQIHHEIDQPVIEEGMADLQGMSR